MAKENLSSPIFYWSKIMGVHNTCRNAIELHRSTLKPKGWLNADVLFPPTIIKLMHGYCPKLELQFYHYYFIEVSNSKSTEVQRPKVYTSFTGLWRKIWTLLPKPEPILVHSWVTSLKWPGQKRHGGILTGLGSEVKVALISLESNSRRNIFWGNGIICVCCKMEMTSQGDNREIKASLLTKIYKTSKEKATISQKKLVAQTRLRSHLSYGFDTEYLSFQSSFFLKIQDTQLEQFYSFLYNLLFSPCDLTLAMWMNTCAVKD